jgi:hypothetical protein
MKILLLYLILYFNAVILVELSKLITLDKRVISVSETKDLPATFINFVTYSYIYRITALNYGQVIL